MRAVAPLLLIATAALVLLRFPPSSSIFYPRCPLYSVLHVLCPGCGGTRAIADLLHANLSEALRDNALITLLLPFATAYGAICYWRWLRDKESQWQQIHPAALYAISASAAIFTIVRNLPLR